MQARVVQLAAIAGLVLACRQRVVEPAAPPSTSTQQVAGAAPALPPLSEHAAAYLADCHHRFEVKQEETTVGTTECTFREFDQNCSPDPSGCWEQGQACADACGTPCTSCDDKCAGGCDDCRSSCVDGDAGCLHACANQRVTCRDACLAARNTCVDVDCPAAEDTCESEHLAKRAQLCPRCSELQSCFDDALQSDKDPREVCERKFKRERQECFDWCFEF